MSRLKEKIERPWLLLKKGIWQRTHRPIEESCKRVFVAGMQRSGTNMLMDVLEQSKETDVFHERDNRAFDNYQMRELSRIKKLVDNSKARFFVIKALCELQDLTHLMLQFSPAKTIWIVRDYNDVVNSSLRSFGNHAKQVKRIAKDRYSSGWLGAGMSDETHAIVRQIAFDPLDDGTAAALQWYFRNVLFFEQNFDKDERVLLVSYERLVSRPEIEFKRVFEYIGLCYSPEISKKVSPRSIGKHSAPKIAPEVRKLCDELSEGFRTLVDAASGVKADSPSSDKPSDVAQ